VEAFNFELKLISDIDRVAKRGVDPLRKLEGQGHKTQEALDFDKPLRKLEQQLERINKDPVGFIKLKKAQKELGEQQKKLLEGSGLAKGEGFISALTSKLSFAKLASAAAVGDIVGEGVMKAGELLVEAAHKFVEVIEEGVSRAFEESGKQQTLRLGERLSLGRGGGKEFREDADRFSKLTGFDDDEIRKMLLPARRAGMNQQGVRSAFAAASDVAAGEGRGGDMGRVQELLSGFEHIFLKGGVQERLLPNLGVAIKPFYADLAKQLHVSTDVAKKRAEEGKVDPQLLLNTIYKGIEKKQGGQLGTGTVAYSQTYEARLARLKNLPNEYLKNLVDSPGFQRASDAMAGLLEKLDPDSPAGRRIQAAVESMFDKITAFIGDPAETADKLANAIERTVDVVQQLVPDLQAIGELLLNAADAAATMATKMSLAQAYITGDKAAVARIEEEESDRRREKGIQAASRATEKRQAQVDAGTFAGRLAGGVNPVMAGLGYISDRDTSQRANATAVRELRERGTKIDVHPGAVVVHAAPGDDPDRSHREAGAALQKHVAHALEQAAQEGGG